MMAGYIKRQGHHIPPNTINSRFPVIWKQHTTKHELLGSQQKLDATLTGHKSSPEYYCNCALAPGYQANVSCWTLIPLW